MKVIGVIGAGASGLCAARHILETTGFEPIVWEHSANLGGTWRLSDEVGVDQLGRPVHSSIYQNLKCDLPKVMMAFPDFAFPADEGGDFAHHTVVLKYLEDYAKHYKLLPWIKFGHCVEYVSPVSKGDDDHDHSPPAWEVKVKDIADGTVTTTVCDALLVCNGHFSVPSVPEITNIDIFKGNEIHSHDYREPSPFNGRRVLVLGAGASGLDISLEVSSVAEKVYLSHNFPIMIPTEMPPNVQQVCGIEKATPEGFILKNGKFVEVDTIIYCTGYKYQFPFLSEDCGVQVKNNHVTPLYKHILNANYPSMGFIGVPSRIVVFPLIYYQVCYFMAIQSGQTALPTTPEMLSTIESDLKELRLKGRKDKEYHLLHSDQWEYMGDLASRSGLDPPPTFRQKMWGIVIFRLLLSYPIFKTYSYAINDDGTTIVECRDGKVLSTGWELTLLCCQQLLRLLWRDFFRVTRLLVSMIVNTITGVFKKD